MKIAEALIACGLFIVIAASLSGLLFQAQSFLEWSKVESELLASARDILDEAIAGLEEDFDVSPDGVSVVRIDNFTKRIEVKRCNGTHCTELSAVVTDTRESEGQSSCRPDQDTAQWKQPTISSFDLSTKMPIVVPTAIDVVGTLLYIASNDAVAASPDLFILDISHLPEVTLVSTLDTGPGLAALTAVGNFVYAANTSVNAQLQIIDITDRSHPQLVTSYKLPGVYGSSTPIGTTLFYKAGKVFLGTDKADIPELHYIDVSSPKSPRYLDGVEIGHGINSIFAFKDIVYVASPHTDEMKSFKIGVGNNLSPFSSYNDPGSIGNGKSLSLFLDTLYVGKTYTFSHEELLALSATSSPTKRLFGIRLGASIEGVIGYGQRLFLLLHRATDNFIVHGVSMSTIPGVPIAFDCDKNVFVVISENSSVITFITPHESF